MSNNQEIFIKCIGGIVGGIISGVIVWHLTEGTKPSQSSSLNSSSPKIEEIKPSTQQQPSQPSSKPLPLPSQSVTPVPSSAPTQKKDSPDIERWGFMGISTKTNEAVYVDNSSISKSHKTTSFIYKIGNDLINASAECDRNRWHSINQNTGQDYGWNSPQSQATQSMMNHVCKP